MPNRVEVPICTAVVLLVVVSLDRRGAGGGARSSPPRSSGHMIDAVDDLELARRHAPIVYFDAAEPFLPELVGYRVLRRSGPSPSFDRYLTLDVPEVGRAAAVVEYALWTDWDIQHLYELEHVWSYVDEQGKLLFAEASWHGRLGALIQDGRLAQEGERRLAYAEPGKHAMAPTPEVFSRFDLLGS